MKGLSILIPTWEMHGHGAEFLRFSFDILVNQTFQEFEVIVTDDSEDSSIKDLCEEYSDKFEVHYYKNPNPPGTPVDPTIESVPKGSVNSNYGIGKCKREIIKFLFQDDFLLDNNSLENTYNYFIENDSKWLVTASMHSSDGVSIGRYMVPRYHHDIHLGINTISSPSILSIINEDVLLFDERLIVLMDCDYYKRLYLRYGLPHILEIPTAVNRLHDGQIAANHSQGQDYVLNKEKEYLIKKFGE